MNDSNEHFPPRFLKDLWGIQESIADEVAGLSLREIGLELHQLADEAYSCYAEQTESGELPVPVVVTRDFDAFPPRALRDHWAETEAAHLANAVREERGNYPDTRNLPGS